MIVITITGELTGQKAQIWEKVGKKGRRSFVWTYHAIACCTESKLQLRFAVVRASSAQVFGCLPERFGRDDECPPSGNTPYSGFAREDGPKGFRIQLYEHGCELKKSLKGLGTILRTDIQIHVGAASSQGCFMVAGSRRWYYRVFTKRMQDMIAGTDGIQVIVLPRPINA